MAILAEMFSASDPLHYLPAGAAEVLDLGCNTGQTLKVMLGLGVSRAYGVDINPLAVAAAQRLNDPRVVVHQASADALPLADHSVDFVLCSEVLEHVPEPLRPAAVAEIHRVLRPSGVLALTVPHAGLFAGLDPANVRFRFPALYRRVSRFVGGASRDAGFERQKHGVVWHHHFSVDELRGLLQGRFAIEHVRFRGAVLVPLCDALAFPFYRKRLYDHPVLKALLALSALDYRFDAGPLLGYDVLLVARRLGSSISRASGEEDD